MTRRAEQPRTRSDFLNARDVLVVVRETPPAPPAANGQPAVVRANRRARAPKAVIEPAHNHGEIA